MQVQGLRCVWWVVGMSKVMKHATQYVGMHFATAWAQIPSELETVFMPQNLNSLLATFSASFIIHYL